MFKQLKELLETKGLNDYSVTVDYVELAEIDDTKFEISAITKKCKLAINKMNPLCNEVKMLKFIDSQLNIFLKKIKDV